MLVYLILPIPWLISFSKIYFYQPKIRTRIETELLKPNQTGFWNKILVIRGLNENSTIQTFFTGKLKIFEILVGISRKLIFVQKIFQTENFPAVPVIEIGFFK